MRASYEQIAALVEGVSAIPGDFAEFGVWRGDTFVGLAAAAAAHAKRAHAIDGFCGMGAPTARDYTADGKCEYPLGALNVGGSGAFRALVAPFGGTVRVWEGMIPTVLWRLPPDLTLAFAHVDLDQYKPTRQTLDWLPRHISPGGIICCHDWYPDLNRLASAAIKDWIGFSALAADFVKEETETHHIVFRKRVANG